MDCIEEVEGKRLGERVPSTSDTLGVADERVEADKELREEAVDVARADSEKLDVTVGEGMEVAEVVGDRKGDSVPSIVDDISAVADTVNVKQMLGKIEFHEVKVLITEKDEEWLDDGEPVSDTRCFRDTVAEDEREDVRDGRLDFENVKVSV